MDQWDRPPVTFAFYQLVSGEMATRGEAQERDCGGTVRALWVAGFTWRPRPMPCSLVRIGTQLPFWLTAVQGGIRALWAAGHARARRRRRPKACGRSLVAWVRVLRRLPEYCSPKPKKASSFSER